MFYATSLALFVDSEYCSPLAGTVLPAVQLVPRPRPVLVGAALHGPAVVLRHLVPVVRVVGRVGPVRARTHAVTVGHFRC